ncbi:MAG: hypothetical protein ACO1OX_02320 [Novosphingobium sp.]
MGDFAKFNDKQIRNLIENYQRQNKGSDPYYHELLEENSRRSGNGLDFQKTLEAVKAAAREGRFLAYKELADRSGCEWNKVRHSIPRHLQALLEYCHARGMPLLSAIVVNKHNAQTGRLDEASLTGFVRGVEEIGLVVADPESFLANEQQKIFEWAKDET